MQRFMIGQYGGFDYNKFHKDFKAEFYGVEACSFKTEKDCRTLLEAAQKYGFHIGVHFPLRANPARLRDALFLSQDDNERSEAFRHIQEELERCYAWVDNILNGAPADPPASPLR